MLFIVFWRGSGENHQITSAQDRGVSWRRLIRPHRKLQHFGPARWRLGRLGWAGWAGLGGLGCAGLLCDALRSKAKKTISTTAHNCSPAQSWEALRSIMFTLCVLLAAA